MVCCGELWLKMMTQRQNDGIDECIEDDNDGRKAGKDPPLSCRCEMKYAPTNRARDEAWCSHSIKCRNISKSNQMNIIPLHWTKSGTKDGIQMIMLNELLRIWNSSIAPCDNSGGRQERDTVAASKTMKNWWASRTRYACTRQAWVMNWPKINLTE